MIEAIFESKPIQTAGKAAFFVGFVGGSINILTRMEFLQSTIVIASGVVGLIYLFYKLSIIRIDRIERNEARVAEGKDPIKFFGWMSRKKTSRK